MISIWPCHDLGPQQDLGLQSSQAAADHQTNDSQDKGCLPPVATTSGEVPPLMVVSGREAQRIVLRVGGASPLIEVQGSGATV